MTIILAVNYGKGILVGYDTAVINKTDDEFKQVASTHKFRQIRNYPIGFAVTGKVDEDIFSNLEHKLYTKGIIEGISKFLVSEHIESCDRMFFPHLFNRFVFVIADKNKIMIGDNYTFDPREVNYAGIGFGYYPKVKELIENQNKTIDSLDSAVSTLKKAIGLSKKSMRKILDEMKDLSLKD